MEGSSPKASAAGPRITVQGPFRAGAHLRAGRAYQMPAATGSLTIAQRFPADARTARGRRQEDRRARRCRRRSSRNSARCRRDGEMFIAATGGADRRRTADGARRSAASRITAGRRAASRWRWPASSSRSASGVATVRAAMRRRGRRAEAADRAPRELFNELGAPRARSPRRPRRRAALSRRAARRSSRALEQIYGALDGARRRAPSLPAAPAWPPEP